MKSMVPCQSISPFYSFHQTYTPWSSFHCAFHGNSKLPARPLFFLPWVGHGCLVLLGMYHHGADLFSKDSWSSSPDRPYTHPLSTPLFSCPCCDALPYLPPSNLWRPPRLAYNPASFFTRNTRSITQSDLTLPLPSAAAHPPPSCSLAFSPPTSQVCLVSMPQDLLLFSQETYMKMYPFSSVPPPNCTLRNGV